MKRMLLLLLTAVMLVTAGAIAQPPLEDPSAPPYPPPPQAQERIRTMQMWKLTEVLELTSEQAEKFLPLYREFQEDVEAIRVENRGYFDKIHAYIIIEDGKEIHALIEKIEANERKILDRRVKFRREAGKTLSDEQIGKLVTFQREFPGMFRNVMKDMRRDNRREKMRSPGRAPHGGGKLSPGMGMRFSSICPRIGAY